MYPQTTWQCTGKDFCIHYNMHCLSLVFIQDLRSTAFSLYIQISFLFARGYGLTAPDTDVLNVGTQQAQTDSWQRKLQCAISLPQPWLGRITVGVGRKFNGSATSWPHWMPAREPIRLAESLLVVQSPQKWKDSLNFCRPPEPNQGYCFATSALIRASDNDLHVKPHSFFYRSWNTKTLSLWHIPIAHSSLPEAACLPNRKHLATQSGDAVLHRLLQGQRDRAVMRVWWLSSWRAYIRHVMRKSSKILDLIQKGVFWRTAARLSKVDLNVEQRGGLTIPTEHQGAQHLLGFDPYFHTSFSCLIKLITIPIWNPAWFWRMRLYKLVLCTRFHWPINDTSWLLLWAYATF